MKEKKGLITFIQVVVVVISVAGFYFFSQKEIKPTVVYSFNKDLSANTQITAGDLNKINIPSKAINETFELDVNNIIGKYVNTDVYSGQYVIKPTMSVETELNPLKDLDLSKYRKISLPINYVDGLGGDIRSGDKIDLAYIGNGTKSSENVSESGEFTYAKIFMQDVIVYNVVTANGTDYVSKSTSRPSTSADGKDINSGEGGGDLATVILAVTGEQAEEILSRLKTGQIKPIGRFFESESYNTNGFIYGNYDNIKTSSTDPEY